MIYPDNSIWIGKWKEGQAKGLGLLFEKEKSYVTKMAKGKEKERKEIAF